jgi:hypothetical protein
MSFLDNILQSGDGIAVALATAGGSGHEVNVSHASSPSPGDVLTAVDATHSAWLPPTGGGGGGDGGVADALATSGAPVDVSGAAPPTAGQALVATGPGAAHWQSVAALAGEAASQVSVTDALPGVSPGAAAADHIHSVSTGSPAPLTVGGAQAIGAATSLSVSDHKHAMPGIATPADPGFQSAADKTKIDSVESGAQVTSFAHVQTALGNATGPVSLNTQRLTNVLDPINPQDVATKAFVDSASQGLDVKAACKVIARGNIALTGTQTIDGTAVVAGDRVLVAGQTPSPSAANGIYTVAAGAWTRATDADVSAEVVSGMYTFITNGTLYANTGWVLQTENPIVLGTTPLTFVQFSGAGQATAGAGLVKTGSTFDVVAHADGSILANADSLQVGVLATDAQHGGRGGGALHNVATGTTAGFMSATDKARLDAVVATGAPSQISMVAASAGTNANVAPRVDHIHSIATAAPVALTLAGTNTAGAGPGLAPSNHIHALPASNVAPVALTVGASASAGTSAAISNAGHVHAMPGIATVTTDGFMNTFDKQILDGLFSVPNTATNGFRLSPTADDSTPADGQYTNLYLVAVNGDCIALYDALALGWRMCRVNGFSKALSGRTTGRPFDVFLSITFPFTAPIDGSASVVDMEFVDWTSATVRATGLTRVAGVWTKAGDQSRRYLGTVVPSGATTYLWQINGGGTASASMPIWNAGNRRPTTLRYLPSFDTYKIPEGSVIYRWGNVAQAQIGIVTGLSHEPVLAQAICSVNPNSADVSVGIGVDGLSFSGGRTWARSAEANAVATVHGSHASNLLGYHTYIPLMATSYPESTFYGNHASAGGIVSISAMYATVNQ